MTRESKRQCFSPTAQTSLLVNDTQSLGKSKNTHRFPQSSTATTPIKSYQLPNEIIANILDHVSQPTLYQCTLASKRCYAIANPLLWKVPLQPDSVFIDCMYRMPGDRRDALGQHIRVLRGDFYSVMHKLLRLVPYLSQLTHLEGLDTITSKDARLIIRSCPHLMAFNFMVPHLSASVLADIPKYLHQLEAFHWCPSYQQSPSLLSHLSPCSLRDLKLEFTDLMPDATALATIKTFDKLTSLYIGQIAENSLKALVDPSAFPHLTTLQLECCADTDDSAMMAFLNTHPMLEQLILALMPSLTDATLDAICGLSRLTHFIIVSNDLITTAALRRVIKACPLTHLEVIDCEQVAEDAFPELDWPLVEVYDESSLDKIRRSFGLA